MARRATPPAMPRPANLSNVQMQEAIPKIERRIKDLEDFDIETIQEEYDPRIQTLQNRLETLIEGIFPRDTAEYERFHYGTTQLIPMSAVFILGGGPTPVSQVRSEFVGKRDSVIIHLRELTEYFREELGDRGVTPTGRAVKAYEGLDLHPEIARATSELYQDGHYANAIEDAVKALNGLVRLRSGEDAKDGTSLMEFVFSPNSPILKFNALADQSDKDEQKGFMMLFSGAVAGLRNPRAHKIIKDDPESALEFIAFISLLAKLADKARR